MHYKDMNEAKVDKIYNIVSKYKGKKPFSFYLYDDNEQPLTFQSTKVGVKLENELINQLKYIPNIVVKLLS